MRKIIAVLLFLLGLYSVAYAEELATYADVAKALNEVHRAHYGVDSQFLTQVQELGPEDTDKPATRFFFAQALFCSAMEDVFDFPYENYYVWAENCSFTDTGFSFPDSQIIVTRLDGTVGEGGVWDFCPDCSEIDTPPEDERYHDHWNIQRNL